MLRTFQTRPVIPALLCALFAACSRPASQLVINDVTVIDPATSSVLRDMTVVVEGERIVRVGPAASMSVADDARIVDGKGKFLIPGLWDMHVHIQDARREFDLFVANGVLGVRDMGGVAPDVFHWRDQVRRGQVIGPQIVACGPIIDGPSPTNPPISVSVKDASDARRTARELKELGADCLKVHDGVPVDAYEALAAESRTMRLPLVGHVPVRVRTLDATNAGQRTIEHQIGLRGASMAEDVVMLDEEENDVFGEAMRTKNYALIPEGIARKGNLLLDRFSRQKADALYRAFARNGTFLDPTLVTDRSLTFVDDISRQQDARAKYVPPATREWWKPENGMLTRYRTPAYIAFRKRQFAKTLEEIPVAHRAGVVFLAGTDTTIPFIYPGFSLHDELALFVTAGLTPMEALQTATSNPARLLGLDAGSIRAGGAANLVLLDADPVKDIANARKISAVILRGKLLQRNDLDQMLGKAEAEANAQ